MVNPPERFLCRSLHTSGLTSVFYFLLVDLFHDILIDCPMSNDADLWNPERFLDSKKWG